MNCCKDMIVGMEAADSRKLLRMEDSESAMAQAYGFWRLPIDLVSDRMQIDNSRGNTCEQCEARGWETRMRPMMMLMIGEKPNTS